MTLLIGVSALPQARYSEFSECLANLYKPLGTEVMFATGIDIGENRNKIVRRAIDDGYQWLWFVDDDMTFEEDHVERLIEHNRPVVASLYLNRKPPHYPMAFNSTALVDGVRKWQPVSLDGAPGEGLAEIVAAGTGGMLISNKVLAAIERDTWFDHHQSTDDLAFCQRVLEAGFEIALDLAARMGHISEYQVWPVFDSRWVGDVRFSPGQSRRVELGN